MLAARAALALLLAWLPLLGGCAGAARLDPILADYGQGRIGAAADAISSPRLDGAREGRRDGILYLLEQGKILQDAGRFEESERALEQATARMQAFADSPDVSLTGELGQLLTTPAARAYRGAPWERILAETYRALNQLALGDLSEALVHCRRAYVQQVDALARHERELESARREGRGKGVDVDGVLASPEMQREYERVATRVTPAYADWANPFATWLTGLLLWIDGDRTNAAVDLRKAAAMSPRNAVVEGMLEALERGEGPGSDAGRVYVIFEGGLAPVREQVGIVVLTPAAGLSTLTLPTLRYVQQGVAGLALLGADGGVLARTQELADVESIVSADFQSRLAGIVTRELLSIVAKEVGTAQLRNQTGDLGLVLGSLWKLGTAQADTRTWRSAPATVAIAAFERPADGRLRLLTLDPGGGRHLATDIEIPSAPITLVLARAPSLRGLAAHVIALEPRGPLP